MTNECTGETIYLEGSPLAYCRYEAGGFLCWRFDSSQSECPVPMTAALVGLRQIDAPGKRLIMINHSEPMGLFGRIKNSYKIRVFERKDGLYEIVFDYKPKAAKPDLYSDLSCAGKGE
ncbi:MAG: hypothetical protein AB7E49_02955 [Campylobacterales bacterium]